MTDNMISSIIVDSALKIHRKLGPGLLESAYKECLKHELTNRGLKVETEKPRPIIYEGLKLDHGYRIDLLVEDRVVVELKAVEALNDAHMAQILTYMKLGGYELGLLINFHVRLIKDGIKRFIR